MNYSKEQSCGNCRGQYLVSEDITEQQIQLNLPPGIKFGRSNCASIKPISNNNNNDSGDNSHMVV